jgi:hypothetical protein
VHDERAVSDERGGFLNDFFWEFICNFHSFFLYFLNSFIYYLFLIIPTRF